MQETKLSKPEFYHRVQCALAQRFLVTHILLISKPQPIYKIEFGRLFNVEISQNSMSCDCYHFLLPPRCRSLCKHLIFIFHREGGLTLDFLFEHQIELNKEYWRVVEEFFQTRKWNQFSSVVSASITSSSTSTSTSTSSSSSTSTSTSTSSSLTQECSICYGLFTKEAEPFSCTRCKMKSHINCLYDFLKLRNNNQIPSTFPCFICSLDLPLIVPPIHAPPLPHDDVTNDVQNSPRTFASYQPVTTEKYPNITRKNNNNKNKSGNQPLQHPDFNKNGYKQPSLQTSLNRFFDNSSSSNKRQKP